MKPIWIVAAKRTPQGRFLGGLTKYSAVDLGVTAGKSVVTELDPARIDSVIVGNVLGAGLGMNVARQIGIGVGISERVPAFTVNMMCGSGMHAVALAMQSIAAGEAKMVLCGGTESMSNAPYLLNRVRGGYKFGDGVLIDSILRDGLSDAFSNEPMGKSAERLAERYGISREAQDAFAAASQQRYAAAHAAGNFQDELVAVDKVVQDEHPRADTTIATLATLKPAFEKEGTVTAGNASGVNDGAAMLVVCSPEHGKECGLTPLAVITASAAVGCEPEWMGLGPAHAIRKLGVDVDGFDMIEINEAFAAQTLASVQELKLDPSKVNINGGAIALGHPIGASGARLLVHLAHRKPARGLAALCVGGGMGVVMTVERP